MSALVRCAWVGDDPLYQRYHDEEWGLPERDPVRLFEMLILEGAQAGLSWITVLRRREGYRAAFDGFDPEPMARWDERRIDTLVTDERIIRHRGKIESARDNARAWLRVREQHGSFTALIWDHVDGVPRDGRRRTLADVPTTSPESVAMSRELKRWGFRFVGPTICYAFMQAAGLVNDHTLDCHRHGACLAAGRRR